MPTTEYLNRLRRKLDIIRLDAKAVGKHQLVHDIGECLSIVDRIEKIIQKGDQ